MLHFSSPKRSVKLKAQSKTGSANSNPTGESKPIAIFGFVPNAFPIERLQLFREVVPTISKLGILAVRTNPESAAMRGVAEKAGITVVGPSFVANGSHEEYRNIFATVSHLLDLAVSSRQTWLKPNPESEAVRREREEEWR